jgi:CRISPR-associated endonuclease/helicase Cas3
MDGQGLTEDMIEALAREAEAGYDPAALRPRRVGRPQLGGQPSRRVQFRVDAATYAILQERARAERREISEIVRTALERYLGGELSER